MVDVAIIGGGPAGFSAAVNVRARGATCLIVSGDITSNPLAKSSRIDNYIGMYGMNGLEMLQKMKEDALASGAEFRHGHVLSVAPYKDRFMLAVGNDVIEAKRVILATGAVIPKALQGETERVGRGVSYCATCDGMLYRSKKAIVIGDADDLTEEAAMLQHIGVDVTVVAKQRPHGLPDQIPFIQAVPRGIVDGSPFVLQTDREDIPCDVVFALRNAQAPDRLVAGLALDGKYILVDESCSTNINGLYAAGDCTGKPLQIAKAVAQGMMAAFSATASLKQ